MFIKSSFLAEFMFTKLTFPCSMLIMKIARLCIWRFCFIVSFPTRLKYLLEHLIIENDLLTALPGVADTSLQHALLSYSFPINMAQRSDHNPIKDYNSVKAFSQCSL